MLETVREYAREKLATANDAAVVRERHRDNFLELAEEADQKLKGADQAPWLERLEKEYDNIRFALDWSLKEGESEPGLRFCRGLWRFWWLRGHFAEGRGWCERLLGKPAAEHRTRARANALNAAGVLAYFLGDYPSAQARHEESLSIMRDLKYREGVAASLSNLGMVASRQGNGPAAWALYEESLSTCRELGDRSGTALSLMNLGTVAHDRGDWDAARTLHEEGLAIHRELGDRWGIATSLYNLASTAFARNDYPAARALFEESLSIQRELGHRPGVAQALIGLGEVACEHGEFVASQSFYRDGLQVQRELGDRRGIADSLWGLAAVVAPLAAARMWGAAECLREELGSPLFPQEQPRYDRRVAAARTRLGDDAAFDRAWQEGRTLTLEQAIEFAMEKTVEHR